VTAVDEDRQLMFRGRPKSIRASSPPYRSARIEDVVDQDHLLSSMENGISVRFMRAGIPRARSSGRG